MSTPAQLPPHLYERYGIKEKSRNRRIVGVLISGIALALLIFASITVFRPRITFALESFDVTSDTSVAVSWQVASTSTSQTFCVVRAQDSNRQDVGYAIVTVTQSQPLVTVDYVLTTESKATLVEILGCSNSPELKVAAPNFAPGVAIPDQSPPGVAPTIQ